MRFGSVATATQLENRGVVEAVSKFENLVILGMALNYRAASGSDRMQALNEPYHLSYESVESRIRSLPLAAL